MKIPLGLIIESLQRFFFFKCLLNVERKGESSFYMKKFNSSGVTFKMLKIGAFLFREKFVVVVVVYTYKQIKIKISK